MPFHPPKTITSTIESESQLNRNHLINHHSLLKLLQEDTCCKSCVNTFVKEYCKQSICDFVIYFSSSRKQKLSIEQQFEAFLDQGSMLDQSIACMNKPLIVVSSENFGLASEFEVSCFTFQEMISKLESTSKQEATTLKTMVR